MLSKFRSRLVSILGSHKTPHPMAASAPSSGDPIDCMIPDDSMAGYVGGGGAEQYKKIGRMQVDWLREHGGLKEDDDVLEVGCGIGRIRHP